MTENFQEVLKQAGDRSVNRQYRFLLVNEHYLGHVTVHRLFCKALAEDSSVDFEPGRDTIELDTVDGLPEKIQRRFACLRFGTAWMQRQNLDLGRWRFQRFIALLARKRVLGKLKAAQKAGRPYDAIAFHSQTAALGCIDIMQQMPCLVSTDITHTQASFEWNHPLTRWTYQPGIRLEKQVFQQAKAIAVFSDWCREAVLAENPALSADKVQCCPPGAELTPFLEMPLERPAREKLQVLFVGGDFKRKGGDDLLACYEKTLHEFCDLQIVSTQAPSGLEAKGISVYRNLSAYSPELLACYRQADVFVLPTHNEAYGHVFIEAMAAGLPVVATRINAIPGILHPDSQPFLIAPGNHSALIDAVAQLHASPSLRLSLGQAGRERAVAHFDASACFRCYVDWLKNICV